jgi:hypothetical protein
LDLSSRHDEGKPLEITIQHFYFLSRHCGQAKVPKVKDFVVFDSVSFMNASRGRYGDC